MNLRTIIVDDEPLARELLEAVLLELPDIDLLAACASGEEAVETIDRLRPDLVFLDIEMPEMTGLELAMTLIEKLGVVHAPQIIFATAYDRYAVEAFKVNAIGYVLKPIEDDEIKKSIARVRQILQRGQGEDKTITLRDSTRHSQIRLQDGEKIILIPVDSLLRVQADGDYVSIFFKGGNRLIRSTLKAVEASLPVGKFQRIHRSSIVNLEAVRELKPTSKGAAVAELSDGTKLVVSRSYAKGLKASLR